MNMFPKSIAAFFLTMAVVTSDGYTPEKLDAKLSAYAPFSISLAASSLMYPSMAV